MEIRGEDLTLTLDGVVFSFSGGKRILNGLDLTVDEGEIVSLLGSSGSGKTTILNIIAGFLRPDSGSVMINGTDVTDLPTRRRGVGIVFQDYALFPHMSVEGNISYGMRSRSSGDRKERIEALLERVGLTGYGDRAIRELSGGEKQRVALARTIAYEPSVILLDEPLSALDAKLRDDLRRDVRSILKEMGIGSLYVTHDQMEAVSVSDRIDFLRGGRIWESGDPDNIFNRPGRVNTARFMGFENIIGMKGKQIRSMLSGQEGKIQDRFGEMPDLIGFRPESGVIGYDSDNLNLRGSVESVEFRGREHRIKISEGKRSFIIFSRERSIPMIGDPIVISIPLRSLVDLKR